MADWTGVTSHTYDGDNRPLSVSYPTRKTLAYGYDAVGNRTSLVDPDGGTTVYGYDAANNLTGIVDPYGDRTSIVYDALNREAARTMANGIVTTHTFDAAGNETVRASSVAVYTATYDAVGNRLSVAEIESPSTGSGSSSSLVTYTYDSSYQLLTEQRTGPTPVNVSYSYDGLGNRMTKSDPMGLTSYAYNAANALTGSVAADGASTTNAYDANGNLILENANGTLTTFTWDGENRQTSRTDSTGGQTSTYDATGMRVKLVTPTATTQYVRDGQNVLAECDQAGATVARYVDSPGVWGGLTSVRRQGVSAYYSFDMSANTRQLTDSTGAVLAAYLYDAFGVELSAASPSTGIALVPGMSPGFGGLFVPTGGSIAIVNPLRFGGQYGYWRDAANVMYVRARWLDATAGRWVSRDPIGFRSMDWDLYRYVRNNSVIRTDPSGTGEGSNACTVMIAVCAVVATVCKTSMPTWQEKLACAAAALACYEAMCDCNPSSCPPPKPQPPGPGRPCGPHSDPPYWPPGRPRPIP
ncbi:MAG: RHS repeat-associated core domain-containing protein [Capsulimonadaceae bacterium]|nr:RHS repeat-associated core domain-containing protein [Capsulimonadaceae bacterium]